jgi:hypothetical protein
MKTMSTAELSDWCTYRFGTLYLISDPSPQPFDVAWLALDARRRCSTVGPASMHYNAGCASKNPGAGGKEPSLLGTVRITLN